MTLCAVSAGQSSRWSPPGSRRRRHSRGEELGEFEFSAWRVIVVGSWMGWMAVSLAACVHDALLVRQRPTL